MESHSFAFALVKEFHTSGEATNGPRLNCSKVKQISTAICLLTGTCSSASQCIFMADKSSGMTLGAFLFYPQDLTSRLLVGTGVCVISTGISSPSTKCQPLVSGAGNIDRGSRALFQRRT